MPVEIKVPRLGWSMEEGTFVEWLKRDGEFVEAGQPLFAIEGDKAIQDVEAIGSGILRISPRAGKRCTRARRRHPGVPGNCRRGRSVCRTAAYRRARQAVSGQTGNTRSAAAQTVAAGEAGTRSAQAGNVSVEDSAAGRARPGNHAAEIARPEHARAGNLAAATLAAGDFSR